MATAIKMSRALPRRLLPVALSALAFAGVGLLRLPLIAVICALAPIGIALASRDDPAT